MGTGRKRRIVKATKVLKRSVVSVLLSVLSLTSYAQNETRMYLLDMTASMVGFNGAPNVWPTLQQTLLNSIDQICENPQNTVMIVPFADNVKTGDILTVKATTQGKQKLKDYVRSIKDGNPQGGMKGNFFMSWTNIISALDYFYGYADGKAGSDNLVMYLFTDGMQNNPGTDKNDLIRKINEWTTKTQNKVSKRYGFYVFSAEAAKDVEIDDAIRKNPNLFSISDAKNPPVTIEYPDKAQCSIKDKEVRMTLKAKNNGCGNTECKGTIKIKGSSQWFDIESKPKNISDCEIEYSVIPRNNLDFPDESEITADIVTDGLDEYTKVVPQKIRIKVLNENVSSIEWGIK